MSLTREERKLLHQKSQQPTFGSGKPNNDDGFNGDISYRKVEGSGTVQYLKENNSWTAISSSGEMPPIRIAGGGGGSGGSSSSSGVTSHNDLTSLSTDDHVQYLLIDGTRAMTGNTSFGVDGTGVDVTFHSSTAGDKMLWDASEEQLVITGTDGQTSLNVADGNVTIADTLTATKIGAFEASGTIDFSDESMTSVNINSGAIDATTIGASTQAAGDFTAIGAVSAGSIVGTTIDATTDFTIGSTVITDDSIVMTPTSGDTFTLASTTNGATSLTTVDTVGAAAHLTVVVDGNVDIDGLVVTLDAATSIELEGTTNVTGALTTTSTATIGTDLTVTGGDIIYGNGQTATLYITATSHDTGGKRLIVSAGNTTAGTTNNIAGGALVFEGGVGKGSGVGGDIIFKTANAGSSGSSLNALATALTISDDLSATFTGDVSVGDDLFLTSSGSIVNWNSGDVTLTHAAGKLTFGGDGTVELDFNNHEMTNVDIDSGAIDGTAIGAASHSTIKGTTIDATTDFTIDGLVLTADTITNDATLTVDSAGDIILDANSGVTKYYLAGDTNDYASLTVAANGVTTLATFDDGGTVGHLTLDADGDIILDAAGKDISLTDGSGTAEFIFNLEAAPELDVDGAFTIDGSSTITLDSVSNFIVKVNAGEKININTDGGIYLHEYSQSLNNQDYKINNKADLYHFTTGNGDFDQNYTIISEYEVLAGTTEHEVYPS